MIVRALVCSAFVCWALVAAACAAARAETVAPLPPAEQQSLDAFAAAHADCHVWSDGCLVCRRIRESDYACSTPGIACQPAALACQEPEPAAPATPKTGH